MSDNDISAGRVISVLLADGWHRIVPGSFRVGPLSFGAEAGPGTPGFRFEEADAGRPYQPAVLAGPLIGLCATAYIRLIGWLSYHRITSITSVLTLVVGFGVLGLIGLAYPQLYGNGQHNHHGNDLHWHNQHRAGTEYLGQPERDRLPGLDRHRDPVGGHE